MLVLPFAISAMVAIADCDVAQAVPVKPQPLSAVAPASDIQLAAVRGPRGGIAVRGPYGGAAVRGPYGGRAVVGRPYYGGVWYGTGRRYWNGRWWP
jgi:hypothetical protein